MTATRPLWSAEPVSLHRLVDMGTVQSLEILRHLTEPPPAARTGPAAARWRRRAVEIGVAVLGVLAVVALYGLLVTGLSVPVDGNDPGLFGG